MEINCSNRCLRAVFPGILLCCLWGFSLAQSTNQKNINDSIIFHIVDPHQKQIELFWKNENHEPFRSIQNLKLHLEKQHEKLEFAMNGGMFKPDYTPVGLFIQQGKILAPLDTGKGYGNFYLKPNGVFYLHQYKGASIVPTDQFKYDSSITIATQSGPMLITNGKIHPAFNPTSANKVIRNGAGILPDQRIVFAISKQPINFYHFASFFISMGCKEALYLDGYVSRMYLPEKNWKQTDSNVGILIGISRKQ